MRSAGRVGERSVDNDTDKAAKRYRAREQIRKSAGLRARAVSGSIPCPNCEYGSIRYRIDRVGHISAHCSTEGCVDWSERSGSLLY